MNEQQRLSFRKSERWKKFRAKCRRHCSKDFITNKPLTRTWNLHHLDMNMDRYDNLSEIERFLPLNQRTHEALHTIFNIYRHDPKVIERLVRVMDRMLKYSRED